MITRNWYNWWKSQHSRQVITGGAVLQDGNVRDLTYSSNNNAVIGLALTDNMVRYRTNEPGIYLGSGTTPATLDDHKMESMITSGLVCSVATSLDDNNDAVNNITITNNTNADITIGEVGTGGYAYCGQESSYWNVLLMDRTVLDSPVTIPAGGVGQITYTIRMNYPTV